MYLLKLRIWTSHINVWTIKLVMHVVICFPSSNRKSSILFVQFVHFHCLIRNLGESPKQILLQMSSVSSELQLFNSVFGFQYWRVCLGVFALSITPSQK